MGMFELTFDLEFKISILFQILFALIFFVSNLLSSALSLMFQHKSGKRSGEINRRNPDEEQGLSLWERKLCTAHGKPHRINLVGVDSQCLGSPLCLRTSH